MRRAWWTGLVLLSSTQGLVPMRVFCYGDSLTAGTSPPLTALFPYAPDLEKALNAAGAPCVVRHRGLPGVTAADMLTYADDAQNGLNALLKKGKPALSVILAGTNDLGRHDHAEPIVQALCGLHVLAHALGVPTVAVGVPPSGYQAAVPAAYALAHDVNGKLRAWCEARAEFCVYVDHPVATYKRGGQHWSTDGLHLSPEGYRHVGRELAGVVHDRLRRIAAESPK
ncbi:SGNH hydrolase-type esterase domain-containing protein [Pelagophyceae sp. CCMP2097]|nr:SGNH hydrolase-type esterase domain-containing protein [Pelagophyceae sp. CCMP2097]|mmetsp:Transcript_31676/g.106701  ORF Transcript_31676/g.106701 Transcript_31676/m.106701 type:complete len:226 (-) Transcript_31676:264-941(-)